MLHGLYHQSLRKHWKIRNIHLFNERINKRSTRRETNKLKQNLAVYLNRKLSRVRSNKPKKRDTTEKYKKQSKGLSKQTQQCKNLARSNWTELWKPRKRDMFIFCSNWIHERHTIDLSAKNPLHLIFFVTFLLKDCIQIVLIMSVINPLLFFPPTIKVEKNLTTSHD